MEQKIFKAHVCAGQGHSIENKKLFQLNVNRLLANRCLGYLVNSLRLGVGSHVGRVRSGSGFPSEHVTGGVGLGPM